MTNQKYPPRTLVQILRHMLTYMAFLCCAMPAWAQLNGTYTIGGAAPNYATIDDAINALNVFGVTGPVTFLIRGGTYTPPNRGWHLRAVTGMSARNTVTFRPAPEAAVTLIGNTGPAAYSAVFVIDGGKHYILDGSNIAGGTSRDMAIVQTETSVSPAILIINDADFNTLTSCVLKSAASAYGPAPGVVSIASTEVTSGNDSNVIMNCAIGDSSQEIWSMTGVRMAAPDSLRPNIGNSVVNCDIVNFMMYGIYSGLCNVGTMIRNNTFRSMVPTPYGFRSAIAIDESRTRSSDLVISNNRIFDFQGAYWEYAPSMLGIDIKTVGVTAGATLIANNMISFAEGGRQSYFAIRINNECAAALPTLTYNVMYNSVYFGGLPLGNVAVVGISRVANNSIGTFPASIVNHRNNIYYLDRGDGGSGACMNIVSAPSGGWNSSCNLLEFNAAAGCVTAVFGGASYQSLAAYQLTGQEINSVEGNLQFVDPSACDLHILTTRPTIVHGRAMPIPGLTTDFDGQARDALKPDIGADEIGGMTPPPPSNPVRFSNNGHYYEFLPGRLTWADARAAAAGRTYQGMRGHLVTLTSAAENDFVARTFASGQPQFFAWIAGYEPNDDGVWRWGAGPEDGTQFSHVKQPTAPFNYANWQGVEPNDHAAGEDFTAMNLGATFANVASGGWIDSPYPNPADPIEGYVVEYEEDLPINPSGQGRLYLSETSANLHDNRKDALTTCVGMTYAGVTPVQGLQFVLSVSNPVLQVGNIAIGSSIRNPSDWTLTYETVTGVHGPEVRVLLYGHSTAVNLPAGNHSCVLTVSLETGNPATCGEEAVASALTIQNVQAVLATRGAESADVTADPTRCTLTCMLQNSSLRGDVNADGSVDVLDVLLMTDVVIGRNQFAPWQLNSGDLAPWSTVWSRNPPPAFCDERNYGNGVLDVADIVLLVNAILNEEWPNGEATATISAGGREDGTIARRGDGVQIPSSALKWRRDPQAGSADVKLCPHVFPNGITVHMESPVPVRGIQMKLKAIDAPNDAVIRPGPGIAENFDVMQIVRDGEIRVMIYAKNGGTIEAGDRDLFTVLYDVRNIDSVHLLEPIIVIGEGNVRLDVDSCESAIAGVEPPGAVSVMAPALALNSVPNPASDRTAITFSLPQAMDVTLTVTDIMGREAVRIIDNARLAAGAHTSEFDAHSLASGLYFITLRADGISTTRPLTMVR